MRTALSRVLCAAVIGATAAGVGTLYAETLPVPGTPHAAAEAAQLVRTADAYGCYWSPDAPAWVSDRTPDGLCHDGPHGKFYWETGAYSDNDALRADRRLGCWIEPNADPLDGAAEVYCGPVGEAAPGAYGFGPYGFDEFDQWWKGQHPQAAV